MPYLTGLARVARKTGYPVVEVDGWQKRGHGPMGPVRTVVAHHTAGPIGGGNYPSYGTVLNGTPAMSGPLAQYGIGRDGTIYVFGAGLCYHAGKVLDGNWSNDNAIGIEAENNGLGQEWPSVQIDSYVKLCHELVKEFALKTTDVRGHKEIAPGRKIDPAFRNPAMSMVTFRKHVAANGYKKTVAPVGEIKPKPDTKPDTKPAAKAYPFVSLKVGNKHTTESHNAWKYLMAAIDYTDKDLSVNLQDWLRDLTDPQTGKPYYGKQFRIDGIFGEESVKALQNKLHDTVIGGKRLYTGRIDGKRLGWTIDGEFQYLNSQIPYLTKKK